ncbi:MAG: hypothetical protein WCQ99_12310, partial [Pseudomonadota bacterium]
MKEIQLRCPICDNLMRLSGSADHYDTKGSFKTSIYYCRLCDIFFRALKHNRMIDHFYSTSYTQESNEQHFFKSRIGFFIFLLSYAIKLKGIPNKEHRDNIRLVDFGSAYGHFLELAKEQGLNATGIELNDNLREVCLKNGLTVYKTIHELLEPTDLFFAIDS